MSYKKSGKSSFNPKRSNRVNLVIAVSGLGLEKAHAFSERKKAEEYRDKIAQTFGLRDAFMATRGRHGACRGRFMDENAVHLHRTKIE